MDREYISQVSSEWLCGRDILLSEAVRNGEHAEESEAYRWEETQAVSTNTLISLDMETILPGNLEIGIDDLFPPSPSDQLNENPIVENQTRQDQSTLQQMNPPAGRLYTENAEATTFKATIIGNIVYRIDPTENEQIYTRVGTADYNEVHTPYQEKSYLNDENFSKLENSNVLQLTRQALCRIKRKKHANENEKNKAIIRGIGKIAFDKLFDDEEILAGSASGQGTQATGKLSQKYDSDKINVAAAFVASVLSQKDNWKMPMDQLRTSMQNFAADNITGLSDEDWRYFYETVMHRYACARRKVLSGNNNNATKRKMSSKKSSECNSKNKCVKTEEDQSTV